MSVGLDIPADFTDYTACIEWARKQTGIVASFRAFMEKFLVETKQSKAPLTGNRVLAAFQKTNSDERRILITAMQLQ